MEDVGPVIDAIEEVEKAGQGSVQQISSLEKAKSLQVPENSFISHTPTNSQMNHPLAQLLVSCHLFISLSCRECSPLSFLNLKSS